MSSRARSLRQPIEEFAFEPVQDRAALGSKAVRRDNPCTDAARETSGGDFWTETGEGDFALHFLRDKQKREVDFLIVRDGQPWLPIEVKLGDAVPAKSLFAYLEILGLPRGLQIVRAPHRSLHERGEHQVAVIGASQVLAHLA